MTTSNSERSILFVHPHPDDESIACGGTIARYVAEGARVTLVNCTIGEEGEIHLPEIAGLAADAADQLGGYRYTELVAAANALGVTDHRVLGGAGRYRDSGMMDTPANKHPRAFWQADVDEAAGLLAAIIDEVKPQVVVTDNENGSYGHPDHIQTNRVTVAAIAKAKWPVERLFYHAISRSAMERGFKELVDAPDSPFQGISSVDEFDFVTPDEQIAVRFDVEQYRSAKRAAMAAHASQIPKDSWLLSWAENFAGESVEYYRLAQGKLPERAGWHEDLFA